MITMKTAGSRGRRVGSRLDLTVESTGPETCIVRAVGEIDLATADRLSVLLEERRTAGCRILHLDLSAVTFAGCACLTVLIDARHRFVQADGALLITGASRAVHRLLTVTGFDELLRRDTCDPQLPRQDFRRPARGAPSAARQR